MDEIKPWKPPALLAKVVGFVISFAEWRATGYLRRDPAWVREIFTEHCQPCPFYNSRRRSPFGSKGVCERCGCHVSPHDDALNKITWPTSQCPLDPPKWQRTVEVEKPTPNGKEP